MPQYSTGKPIFTERKTDLHEASGLTLEEVTQLCDDLVSDQKHHHGDLILRESHIGVEGAEALAKVLQSNTKLSALHLLGNEPIGDQGVKLLAQALENNTHLKELDLRGNKIGALGAQALYTYLEKNKTLLSLNLEHNPIPEEWMNRLKIRLQRNQAIDQDRLAQIQADKAQTRKRLKVIALAAVFVLTVLFAIVSLSVALGACIGLIGAGLIHVSNHAFFKEEAAVLVKKPSKLASNAPRDLSKPPVIMPRPKPIFVSQPPVNNNEDSENRMRNKKFRIG